MFPRLRLSLITATVTLLVAVTPALAQYEDAPKSKKPAAPAGPAPRTPDGKPDLSGLWNIPYVPDMSKGIDPLPFPAWGAENFKQYEPAKFDYTAPCLPAGLTRQMNTPMPLEIFQSPKRVAILWEAWNTSVIIPTDGRDHPKNPDHT